MELKFNKKKTRTGSFITCKFIDNEYDYIAYDFLHKLLKLFAEHNIAFWESARKYNFIDYPFAYKERQLGSILTPIISKLSNGCIIQELPTTRKIRGSGPVTGWIDYWCIYKDYSFVIEIKHSYNHLTSDGIISEDSLRKWNTMNKYQIPSVKKDILKYIESTKGIIRIGLQIIITELPETETNYINTRDLLLSYSSKLCTKNGKKIFPNYAAAWEIPSQYIHDKYNHVSFPNVMMLAKVYDVVSHLNSK